MCVSHASYQISIISTEILEMQDSFCQQAGRPTYILQLCVQPNIVSPFLLVATLLIFADVNTQF